MYWWLTFLWYWHYVNLYRTKGVNVSWIRASYSDSVEITNKMQPCNIIYYSTVHRRLNMFRAAYHSSAGALTVFAASEFTLRLDHGQSPHVYVNQRLQIQLDPLMMSGMPLETCWAFNKLWNNKFCCKVASCWLFLLSHTMMHRSMNINL
jgi:hypothetical protein